ncbi:MAG: 16S rRNA (cytosine(1402)-N(4))-methyltransferase RsmH [Deltaproteobacteria bacterium]|nr:16S rRNA (cytosine(1402)-N(4))-methyltransferase RsmH [Deltaproteobacteria bacterium]
MSSHIPVLLGEAMDILNIEPGNVYVDGTLGGGGFSEEILKRLNKGGFLIGIDRDAETVKNVRAEFESKFDNKNFKLFHSNFSKIDEIVKAAGFTEIDGVVLDLGISSIQLEGGRGFSFNEDEGGGGGLDMRMDKETVLTAYDIVNGYSEKNIADIIYKFGDEKFSRRIAKRIIEYRKNKPVETSLELADIVRKAVYRSYGKFKKFKTDPATKTFMALRIFVNAEYDSLSEFLEKLKNVLKKGGKAVIISFHSGEDRLVKHFLKNNLYFNPLNKKPIVPGEEEIKKNPRSRSAKLRAFYHV